MAFYVYYMVAGGCEVTADVPGARQTFMPTMVGEQKKSGACKPFSTAVLKKNKMRWTRRPREKMAGIKTGGLTCLDLFRCAEKLPSSKQFDLCAASGCLLFAMSCGGVHTATLHHHFAMLEAAVQQLPMYK